MINLQVITVTLLLGGPGPTLVCALSCNTYTVSGNNSTVAINPSTVDIIILSVMLTIKDVPLCSEYCVIVPLVVSGGIHCKITELELTDIIFNERGSLGATYTNSLIQLKRYM